MLKYFFKRLFRGLLSVIVAVVAIMILLFVVMDKMTIFQEDEQYQRLLNNQKIIYRYTMWEKYSYLDYVTYNDYLNELVRDGELEESFKESIAKIGKTAAQDKPDVAEYVAKFTEYYESKGYEVIRLDAVMATPVRVASGGQQHLFAAQNTPVLIRVAKFFGGLLHFDSIHYADGDIEDRGLSFTLHDPVYGGEKFSPAIIGNGTYHKYLLYFDRYFPYIHQNFTWITLGQSYTVNKGVEVLKTMGQRQGAYITSTTYYPTGLVAEGAEDLHSATYAKGTRETTNVNMRLYSDDYTSVDLVKTSGSKVFYSFVVSIFGSIFSYLLGLPLGVLLAKNKDTWIDQLGSAYNVFMIAVPSLSYYFMIKALGSKLGLPTSFSLDNPSVLMYLMPVVTIVLAGIAGQMKWMRRYMVDQMNSDYVKFARAEGLSEREIFSKYIFKNAAIPIVHGIPGMFVGAISGSIIMERVYIIPGVGGLFLQSISSYDNGVIVGLAVFYGLLSILSTILGDILMAIMDPRISYTSKAR